MASTKIVTTVICLWVACLPFTHATTRKQVAEDIIKRVLSIPDYDKVFNSVLGRIQNNRQGLVERAKSTFSEDIDCEETEGGLSEYTESIENSRDRGLRHGTEPSLERMCIVNRTIHRLNTNEYEYRPAYFEEVRCGTASDDKNRDNDYELCSIFGFSCVQRNKTIHLTRRRYTSDCWETKTLVIPGGCECMWPKYKL